MSAPDSLDLGAVRKRFTDSADTLEQLRERLQAIALAEDTAGTAAAALEDAASRLGGTATALGDLADGVATATRVLRESLDAAAEFLARTDLGPLLAELDALRQSMAAADALAAERFDALASLVGDAATAREETASVRLQLAAAEARAADAERRAVEGEAALAALKAAIPERTAKKMGL